MYIRCVRMYSRNNVCIFVHVGSIVCYLYTSFQKLNTMGWLFSIALVSLGVLAACVSPIQQKYCSDCNQMTAVMVAVLHSIKRPMFGIGACWMLFSCITGNRGKKYSIQYRSFTIISMNFFSNRDLRRNESIIIMLKCFIGI